MANDTTLKNVSQRIFEIGEGRRVQPGQVFMADPETAKRLLELYPGEITDLMAEAERAAAEAAGGQAVTVAPATPAAPAPSGDPIDEMTVKDLKEALKAKNVQFKPNAPKAELVELLKGVPAEGAPAAVAPVEPTPLTDTTVLEVGVVYRETAEGANGVFVGTQNGDTVGLLPVDQLTAEERAKLVAEGKLPA